MYSRKLLQWNLRFLIHSKNKFSAIIYSEYGDPNKVLSIKRTDEQSETRAPRSSQVLVQWMASPINPADINQIQGVYPVKPPLPAIGGNEGCALVLEVGSGVSDLKPGDFVIAMRAGLGTWCSHGLYEHDQLFTIDNSLDVVAASMLQVNPSTAYRMLKDFVALSKGDCVVQNGANSAVGRYIVQICRILGLRTINIVRSRPQIEELKRELEALGANEVHTEEEFSTMLRARDGNKPTAKLALNCVGGRSSLQLTRALGPGGQMVTYGGMSQQPVQAPTASLIFSDIALRGFWMSAWYEEAKNVQARKEMFTEISDWYKSGQLKVPPHKKWALQDFKEAIRESTQTWATATNHHQERLKHVFVTERK